MSMCRCPRICSLAQWTPRQAHGSSQTRAWEQAWLWGHTALSCSPPHPPRYATLLRQYQLILLACQLPIKVLASIWTEATDISGCWALPFIGSLCE